MAIDKKEKLVSLCLFTYNQERFVSEALEGIFSQTYQPLEVIISDDCSSDNTFELIKKKVDKYQGPAKIILNRNDKNIGLCNHVNKVFGMAKGEYIFVAAGDDISLPNRIENYMSVFKSDKDIVSISCTLKEINNSGNIKSNAGSNENSDKTYLVDDYVALEKFHINGASRAIHRSVYETFGNLNAKCPTEDTPFLLRSFMLGKVVLLAEELVLYRVHDNNLSNDKNVNSTSFRQIYNQYKRDIKIASSKKIISKNIESALLNRVKAYMSGRLKKKYKYKLRPLINLVKNISFNS